VARGSAGALYNAREPQRKESGAVDARDAASLAAIGDSPQLGYRTKGAPAPPARREFMHDQHRVTLRGSANPGTVAICIDYFVTQPC